MGKSFRRYTVVITILCLLATSWTPVYAPRHTIYQEQCQVQKESTTRTREIVAEVTAFTGDPSENGGYEGLTVEGKPLEEGHVAADDLPLGTKVIIEGKEYIVADRFGGNYRNRIDIYMPSRESAYRFGRQHLTVKIIEEEK